MDISVSRLNKRMALELPPEFPLGLVFVVGEVKKLANGKGNAKCVEFFLCEGSYLLKCRLSDRAADEVTLNEGDLIRAGGHLAFEPTQAGYYLLARDVEILSEYHPSRASLQKIVADKQEQVQTTNLVPAEIPPWVEQLAPPEIRAELEERKTSSIGFEAAAGDVWRLFAGTNVGMEVLVEEPTQPSLNANLIDFLSEAMDDQEDVELTPELLAEFEPTKELAGPSDQDLELLKELEAALMMTILKEDSLPAVEIGKADLGKIKKVTTGDLRNDQGPNAQLSKIPVVPVADVRPTSMTGLDDVQVATRNKTAPKNIPSEPSTRTTTKLGRPENIGSNPALTKPRAHYSQVPTRQGYVPWYVVGFILLLTVLFVALFVVVALTSNVLPLPITFPG